MNFHQNIQQNGSLHPAVINSVLLMCEVACVVLCAMCCGEGLYGGSVRTMDIPLGGSVSVFFRCVVSYRKALILTKLDTIRYFDTIHRNFRCDIQHYFFFGGISCHPFPKKKKTRQGRQSTGTSHGDSSHLNRESEQYTLPGSQILEEKNRGNFYRSCGHLGISILIPAAP